MTLLRNRKLLGTTVLLVMLIILVGASSGKIASLLAEHGDTIEARFRDTSQLKKGDPVRVHGVTIGRVKRIRLDDGGRTATVEMEVFQDARPIHADASARLRWRTLLGGSFSVALDPGTPGTGELGSRVIPVSRTRAQTEIETLFEVGRSGSKRGIRTLLREAPAALEDADLPREALTSLAARSRGLGRTLSIVRGQRERDLRPLIGNAERTVRALDAPNDGLRRLVSSAAAVTATTAARQGDIAATIDHAARIQPGVRATLAAARRSLDIADPVLADLRDAAPDIAPTVDHLRPTLRNADDLLQRAKPLLADLGPATTALARASQDAAPLVRELTPSIRRIARTILPDLAAKDAVTGMRTYEIAGPTIASLNGSAATFDTEGHLFRFPAIGGERALSDLLPCNALITDPESESLLQCQSLEDTLERFFGYRPEIKLPR